MKHLTLACALLCSSAAVAADLGTVKAPPVPAYAAVYNWTGFAIEGFGLYGVNFGGANVHDDLGIGLATDLASQPHGPGVGGGFRYFYQPTPGGFAFGVRAQIAYANMQASAASNDLGVALQVKNATNYFGDADACLGLPLSTDGKLLGTVCGGFAFGGAKPNLQVATLQQAASDTSTGWDVGFGLDYALTQNWFVGIEGRYTRLGDRQLSINIGGVPIVTSNNQYEIFTQLLRVGYKF